MPNSGYFDTPFGVAGTRTAVPDGVQPDGSVSYSQGYGVDYTLDPTTNPDALNIEQDKFNQILYDITLAIQYNQQGLPAPFITSAMNGGSPFSYGAYATVIYSGVAYQSLVGSNTDTPPSAKWQQINLAPNTFVGGVTTGSANAQVNATVSPAATSFTSGQSVVSTAGFTNTGSMTYSAGGETALIVKKNSGSGLVNLSGGEVVATNTITMTKNLAVPCWVFTAGANLGALAYLGISGNSGANDGSGNYAPAIFNSATGLTGATRNFVEADWGNLIKRSNSGTAMTDTLPGTGAPLPNGWFCYLENVDVAASDTIAVGSGGTINYGMATGSQIAQPGQIWLLESQGAGVYTIGLISYNHTHAEPVSGDALNFKSIISSTTVGTLSADEIVLKDANGNTVKLSSVSQAYATGTSGAGGLDTGSIAASTWYYEYLIYNPTTRISAAMISLSASAPTLPSGYTFSKCTGEVRTDGSSHLIGKLQRGNNCQYLVGTNLSGLPIIISGSQGNINTPVYASASVANFVPPTAVRLRGMMAQTGTVNGATMAAPNNNYGATQSTSNPPFVEAVVTVSTPPFCIPFDWILESSNVYYASNNSGGLLAATGWATSLLG